MKNNGLQRGYTYSIRVKETLERDFGNWLDDLRMIPQENGETSLISTFADQPALRGFLEQLWNLNLTIISVERMKNEN